MEFITGVLKGMFFFWDRKSLKKNFLGEFDLAEEELVKIQNFLDQIVFDDRLSHEEPDQNKQYQRALKRQIEQKKTPYLKELSVEELDFLLARQIDIDGIMDVIFAKSSSAQGLAAILWNAEEKRYEQRRYPVANPQNTGQKIFRKLGFEAHQKVGFAILFIISFIIWFFYIWACGVSYELGGVTIFPIVVFLVVISLAPVCVCLPDGIHDAGVRLQQEKYQAIFRSIENNGSATNIDNINNNYDESSH